MRSDTWTVRQIFQDRRQYCVPFYQRAYVWNQIEQWEPLWQDIKIKAQARLDGGTVTPHFLGAVVVEPQSRIGLRGVDAFHIIDGQQRLTTLQYVLTALLIAFREIGVQGLDVTLDQCLENGNPDTMNQPEIERYKVWPTFRDRTHYESTMAARALRDLKDGFSSNFTRTGDLRRIGMVHPPSLAAIWFFAGEFIAYIEKSEASKDAAAEALAMAVLQDLKLVLISLEADDDAQVIFETMNGRGATLHATDLIRNFIFMRADRDGADAQALYDGRWTQFESNVWSTRERRGRLLKPKLEWLIYTALQAETHTEVDLPRLYADYKAYALNGGQPRTAEAQLLTLDRYAVHYTALTTGQGSLPVARFGRRIAAYETTTIHSLALLISASPLSDQDKAHMFNELVSYIVRRAVCGLTPKNYNNAFMAMIRHLAKNGTTSEALRAHMASSSSDISRWPTNAEFKNACKTAPLYYGRLDAPKMRQLLTELEGELRAHNRSEEPEIPNLANLDIDHIMPRSWYTHWPLADGTAVTSAEASHALLAERNGLPTTAAQEQIRERELSIPTLGNLTLLNLSVNREAQHREFQVKRDLLIRNTNLSLNVQLLDRPAWDIKEIAAQGDRLADAAARLYPGPPE
ncbi:DUF262 domain-containing HNH endonuclease family protein [Dokdonella soli]|uniref:DUF262 domain-containing protein n=1 Tax=Dokdonella soli TaxID=529810 RepID=A0ABP3TW67_9GAMM